MSMEQIMEASFGEASSEVRANYKKVVNVAQYESEVIELGTILDMGERDITGAERVLISAMLQAQLEYSAYCNLAFKGLVTATELDNRKKQLEGSIQAIKNKAEEVLGRDMDEYFKHSLGTSGGLELEEGDTEASVAGVYKDGGEGTKDTLDSGNKSDEDGENDKDSESNEEICIEESAEVTLDLPEINN